eukprot:jgi/Tetstr1/433553/TSEL_022821.t1
MDKYTCSLLRDLKGRNGVCNVQFETEEPCSAAAVNIWEAKHVPYCLPEDYASFLSACNGMTMTWDLQYRGEVHKFGCLHVNGISDVVEVPLDTYPPDDRDIHPPPEFYDGQAGAPSKQAPVAAFDIDHTCTSGRCALMYFQDQQDPQIWFQDAGCSWNYLASTFTEYFRVLNMYHGIPRWQYAFTKYGLDPVTRRWVRFICPERLSVRSDMADSANQRDADSDDELLAEAGIALGDDADAKGHRPVKAGKARRMPRPGTAGSGSGAPMPRDAGALGRRDTRPARV